jgi:Bacteriophage HK97-gp10, putative tail-component
VGTFTAQIKAFADRSKEKIEAVVKQSAQEVFSIAQTPIGQGGRMPVDTGFLRNSLAAELNGATVGGGADAYVLAVAGMELGDVIFAGWTANYARFQEYGTSAMAGNFYMLGAAQQWQAIVARNAEAIRNT